LRSVGIADGGELARQHLTGFQIVSLAFAVDAQEEPPIVEAGELEAADPQAAETRPAVDDLDAWLQAELMGPILFVGLGDGLSDEPGIEV